MWSPLLIEERRQPTHAPSVPAPKEQGCSKQLQMAAMRSCHTHHPPKPEQTIKALIPAADTEHHPKTISTLQSTHPPSLLLCTQPISVICAQAMRL
eukprot:891009-Pelagomonas_calceolata.AAC.3